MSEEQWQAKIDAYKQALSTLMYQYDRARQEGVTIGVDEFNSVWQNCMTLLNGSQPTPARSLVQLLGRRRGENEKLSNDNAALLDENARLRAALEIIAGMRFDTESGGVICNIAEKALEGGEDA